jgi:proteasome lid subunit RPN8/RPN11
MSVYRMKLLPEGKNRGQLILPQAVANATLNTLRQFYGRDGPHEGLVYLAGRIVGKDCYALAAVSPRCSHSSGRVIARESAIGEVARIARQYRLGIIAQVHSHPTGDTRHSDGDDNLILMPFEGMYSIVVANYGRGGLTAAEGAGVHQYQDRRWVRIPPKYNAILIVSGLLGN